MSIVAVVPVAQMAAANLALEEAGFGLLGRTYLEILRAKETTGTPLTDAEALVTSRTG